MRLLCYKPAVANFGDDLNAHLWPHLAPGLFARSECDEAFVGIGTIVGLDPGPSRRLHVFSSGAGYARLDAWAGCEVRYHCVRGPLTGQLLGLPADRVLTDGAILTPLLPAFDFASSPAGPTVVVPHFETVAFPGWTDATQLAGFELLDPRDAPQNVIAQIARASLVLTESLHGAILADAYGVPWQPFTVSRNFSTAKWCDWTLSLGLSVEITLVPPPDPMPLLRFGKRVEPFGAILPLDPDAALDEFSKRIAPSPFTESGLKAATKHLLERTPAARRLLGYSPARTASALTALSRRDPYLSSPAIRQSLRDEMQARLDHLAREDAGVLAC